MSILHSIEDCVTTCDLSILEQAAQNIYRMQYRQEMKSAVKFQYEAYILSNPNHKNSLDEELLLLISDFNAQRELIQLQCNENQKLQNENELLEQKVKALVDSLNTVTTDKSDLEYQIVQLKANNYEVKIQAQLKQIQDLQQQLVSQKALSESLKQQLRASQLQTFDKDDLLQKSIIEYKSLQLQLQQLEQVQKQSEIINLQNNNLKLQITKLTELEQNIKSLNALSSEQKTQIKTLQGELLQKQSQATNLYEELIKQRDFYDSQLKIQATQMNELVLYLNGQQNKVVQTQLQMQSNTTNLIEIRQENRKVDEIKKQLKEQIENNANLNREKDNLQNNLFQLQTELTNCKQTNESLKMQLNEKSQAEIQIEQLIQSVDLLQQKCKYLDDARYGFMKENQLMKQAQAENDELILLLQKQATNAQNLIQLKTKFEHLDEKNLNYREEITELRKKLTKINDM
ncbi:Hypothetical_protein [Hexamita inflata]|uniref:Hypothetical_protein n=1 Tax=Hexamita inflata TaxID=28002 RepID=A0AA86QYF6_9EUKA|nr:Hypothetical protein HINF_LOCUS51176 [Hexamita inflata]